MPYTAGTGLTRSVLDIFFPPVCPLCEDSVRADALPFCKNCSDGLLENRISSPFCDVCGVPFALPGEDRTCGMCLVEKPPFIAARSAYVYRGAVMEVLHRFKYSGKAILGSALGKLLAETAVLLPVKPDLIVPVPLHIARLRTRGFNQSLLLAKEAGKKLAVPVEALNLERKFSTTPQVELKAEERTENVKGAFSLKHPQRLKGKTVLLIDDVYTTGSTVKECSRVLKKAGAQVFVVTLARTVNE